MQNRINHIIIGILIALLTLFVFTGYKKSVQIREARVELIQLESRLSKMEAEISGYRQRRNLVLFTKTYGIGGAYVK